MGKKRNFNNVGIAAVAFWAFVIGTGWTMLSKYENTPGKVQASPQRWPSESRITQTPGKPTLIMFAHPRCPCSRASMGELELIVAHCRQKAEVKVLFVRPEGVTEDWTKTDLWQSARAIPGVEAIIDEEGEQARFFQARVSGQTMLYDAKGELVFSGGITSSRGHSGDNTGRTAVETFLNTGTILARQTPFFGCWLFSNESNRPQGGV